METMRLMKHVRTNLVVAALIAACATFGAPAIAAERVGGPEPGDLVRVTVYGQPDLTTLARVSRDNTITFPFIGEVQVGGVSTSQAQGNIARALDQQGIVRNPQVNVLVETEGSLSGDFVTILGYVQQPGRYPLGDDSQIATRTLLDLMAVAGGTTPEAHSRVIVYRNGRGGEGPGERMEIDLDNLMQGGELEEVNLALNPGDVVMVPETDVFYIYGQVSRPGRYPLEKDMMVMQAISVGGGVSERGNESGIVLTRLDEDGDRRRLDAKLEDPIEPGDVIYVKERFF